MKYGEMVLETRPQFFHGESNETRQKSLGVTLMGLEKVGTLRKPRKLVMYQIHGQNRGWSMVSMRRSQEQKGWIEQHKGCFFTRFHLFTFMRTAMSCLVLANQQNKISPSKIGEWTSRKGVGNGMILEDKQELFVCSPCGWVVYTGTSSRLSTLLHASWLVVLVNMTMLWNHQEAELETEPF